MEQFTFNFPEMAAAFIAGNGAFMVLSAAVRALPEPKGDSSFYLWFYRFANDVMVNWDKSAKFKSNKQLPR